MNTNKLKYLIVMQLLIFVFLVNLSSYAEINLKSAIPESCQCPNNLSFNGNSCTSALISCNQLFFDPVCGCDFNQYDNECDARINGIKSFTEGPCECIHCGIGNSWDGSMCVAGSDSCEDEPFDPVCNCFGFTFDNSCLANFSHPVFPGACSGDNCKCEEGFYFDGNFCIEGTINCPTTIDTICGCDGIVYDNQCLAYKNGVKETFNCDLNNCLCAEGFSWDGSNCVSYFIGCSPDQFVTYSPVCGCDGMTYDNACLAKALGVKSYSFGQCLCKCPEGSYASGNMCVEGELNCGVVPSSRNVCGCDDITYPSICHAQAAGILSYTSNSVPGMLISTPCGNECRCDEGEYFDGLFCIEGDIECDSIFNPVCGCNHVTYTNLCEARKDGITKSTNGLCSDCKCNNGKYWDGLNCLTGELNCKGSDNPVCGCDQITYNNECHARQNGIMIFTEGYCQGDECKCPQGLSLINSTCEPPEDFDCSPVEDEVCGCDGMTYLNPCEANRAGIKTFTTGPCDDFTLSVFDEDLSCMCLANHYWDGFICIPGMINCTPDNLTEDNPVCGCDGIEYQNPCRARDNGIMSFTFGECADCICTEGLSFLNNECISEEFDCPNEVDLVCGCDGTTYNNKCLANRNGVKKVTEDACPGVETISNLFNGIWKARIPDEVINISNENNTIRGNLKQIFKKAKNKIKQGKNIVFGLCTNKDTPIGFYKSRGSKKSTLSTEYSYSENEFIAKSTSKETENTTPTRFKFNLIDKNQFELETTGNNQSVKAQKVKPNKDCIIQEKNIPKGSSETNNKTKINNDFTGVWDTIIIEDEENKNIKLTLCVINNKITGTLQQIGETEESIEVDKVISASEISLNIVLKNGFKSNLFTIKLIDSNELLLTFPNGNTASAIKGSSDGCN